MVRLDKCYSASRTLKMKYTNRRIKKLIGLGDILFVVLFILVSVSIFANLRLEQSIARANKVLAAQGIVETQYVEVPVEVIKDDDRIKKLESFLKEKGSPLEPHAKYIVAEADKYDIGWTKLAAISGMESNYCKRTIPGSHNCWGLGGSSFMHFNSYEEAIEYTSRLIGTEYKWNENQGIKAKYCPELAGCNPNWADAVTSFTNEILSLKGE